VGRREKKGLYQRLAGAYNRLSGRVAHYRYKRWFFVLLYCVVLFGLSYKIAQRISPGAVRRQAGVSMARQQGDIVTPTTRAMAQAPIGDVLPYAGFVFLVLLGASVLALIFGATFVTWLRE